GGPQLAAHHQPGRRARAEPAVQVSHTALAVAVGHCGHGRDYRRRRHQLRPRDHGRNGEPGRSGENPTGRAGAFRAQPRHAAEQSLTLYEGSTMLDLVPTKWPKSPALSPLRKLAERSAPQWALARAFPVEESLGPLRMEDMVGLYRAIRQALADRTSI